MTKQRILSAIATTGKLTLGNYLGAMKQLIALQNEHELFIFIANLHALTTPIGAQELHTNIHEMSCLYFACGLDPNKATVFLQSDVLEHAQLGHILLCSTTIGELSRMTQYKDKSSKIHSENGTDFIPTGILTYPTLMAADILLYDANLVPVGKDQKQHIELTRNIAQKMNNKYNTELFTLPSEYINPISNKIMDLQDPTKKMSKSNNNPKSYISLLDEPEEIIKKIKQAVTDSEGIIKYDPINKPGISNLIAIYASLTDNSLVKTEEILKEKNYGELKTIVADEIIKVLVPIQTKYQELYNNKSVKEWLEQGAKVARKIAHEKVQLVQNVIGLNY